MLAAFSALMVVGQRIHAPDWLRERVASRIERGLGGLQLEFGDVNLIVHEGWRPRLRLSDVVLRNASGQEIARLNDASASVAMRPLLRGRLQPKRISLSGAFVTLRRDADGNFALAFLDGASPLREAPSLTQLIEQADGLFLRPQFSALSALRVDSVTLAYEDVGQGRTWTADGGFVQATINDGSLRVSTGFSLLGGRSYASTVEANYTSRIGLPDARFGISIEDLPAQDIAAQAPALAWLEVLRAPISGALRGSVDGAGALGPVSATLQIGAGVLQPNPRTKPIPFSDARTYFTLDPAAQALDFNEVAINSDWGSARGEGRAYLDGVETGRLETLEAQFRLTDLQINPDDLFTDPLALERAEVDFQLKLDPFRLRVGRMTVWDEDRTLRLSGGLLAREDGWQLSAEGSMDRITPAQLLAYWPPRLAPKPRDWVTKNLTAAQVSDIDLALRLEPGQSPVMHADFEFDEATVRYSRHLPPLTGAAGHASLLDTRFTVMAERGRVITESGDEIDAAGSAFIIPDIGIKKAAPGILRLQGAGPVRGVMSMLDAPPDPILTRANLPVDLAEGQVTLTGTLALPLKKRVQLEDMEFHFTGAIDDVRSEVLVPGHVVRAPRLSVAGDQTGVVLEGNAFFGEVPLSARWRQPIGKGPASRSRLTGQIEVGPELLQELNVGLPPGMVRGRGVAELSVGIGGGAPVRIEADSTLQGLVLAVPQLGWSKPAGRAGQFSLSAQPGPGGGIEAISLQAAGLRLAGSIALADGGGLERARLSRLTLGNWLDVPIDLVGRAGGGLDIRVRGGRLDLRGATFGPGGGGGGGPAPRIDAALDRLQITESIALTGFRGRFETAGGLGGPFSGRVNGQTEVQGQVVPRGTRSAVVIQSGDAGGVFRAGGILKQARGGSLRITLEPTGAPGFFDGQLRARNTRIQDAPAMAALLNAVSVVGLIDEMSGQGIQFAEIDGRFRLSPGQITIREGSAVGPSIGLSLDGTIDTVRKRLNLRGVISPVYLLNAIGSVLTRRGEGMIGFTYRLTGSTAQPQVWVNPLSGLAPGPLREIFREPPPASAPGDPAPPERPDEPDTPSILDNRPGEDR